MGEKLIWGAAIIALGPSCSRPLQSKDAVTRRENLKETLSRFFYPFGDRETLDRMLTILHERLRAFPLGEAISAFIDGSKEIREKLPQKSPIPGYMEFELLTKMFTLSDLYDLLESPCEFSFAAFSIVVGRVGRICSPQCPPIGPPANDRPDYRIHDPYSNHVRHRIPTKLYQSPEAKVPPDRSSTRIESDFCSFITTVQRISPLRLFKIRWSLMPIIFPSS